MPHSKLEPKLLTVLREGYTRTLFSQDLTAGIITGIVALPLAIAFAIASGVKPEQGLYTAVIAGFLISILSGSRVQIGGPTDAFIVLIYGIVQKHGYDGLAVATMLAGALLIVMGISRLGSVIKYIPFPVTVGFTSGIALIIAAGQIPDFFGLNVVRVPPDFVDKWQIYMRHFDSFDPISSVMGLATVIIVALWPRVTHRLPGSLVAIALTTAAAHFFQLPVDTVGSRFGAVSAGLPSFRLPVVSWDLFTEMFSPALSIALLAGIESLLCAVVADGMTGRRHRSNMELIAQGVANIASPLFGGIPATGAIARTATNVKNGGKTPISGIIHATTLLIIMLFFGRWAALIPLPTLAGILLVVAYHMSEWRLFVKLFRAPKSDLVLLLSTFSLTVLVDLTVAIQSGVVLAAFLFMRRMAEVTTVGYVTQLLEEEEEADDPNALSKRTVPAGIEVFEVDGPFFFGAADKFKHTVGQIRRRPKVLILRMRRVLSIDATGLKALEDVYSSSRRNGTTLVLSGVHAQPLVAMQRSGFLDTVGEENVLGNIDDALNRGREIMGLPPVEPITPFVPTVSRERMPVAP